ncbi:MAG: DUF493 domain-containing protein [Sulfurospirillum sp.]
MENTKELKLDYPCNWQYKMIINKDDDAKKIAKDVLKNRDHSVKKSNNSSKGKYSSHSLEVLVHNNDDRIALFDELKQHNKIKFVL